MTIRCIPAFMRKPVISAIALTSLTSVVFLDCVGQAAAKPMTPCQVKHSFCSERCIMNSKVGSNSMAEGNACIKRTCTHQFEACARASGESSDPYHDSKGMTPPVGGVPRRS
jgi:heterodisulfide reductase subunit A-like polyferredoxin